ncbi:MULTISPECIES: hypothetical protein [unclassified Paenibacillus]|nr:MULTISPECIES: hypothetical protein [unclassified Paenibacillus]MDF9846053.1 tetratricopeptide (TPR) repeat protein [Paenibacillus sp. PastM-2]MDH6477643.1 tetratricopeptide (TPR) repeat protein [Paenibacillus sp. PastH-2]
MNADSLIDMLKASFSLDNWTAMIEISDKLIEVVSVIHATNPNGSEAQMLKRSLVYYFGFSLCAKGIALQKLGNYETARECIKRYSNLSWVKLNDADSLKEIVYYKSIAVANTFVIDLLEGDKKVLPEYVEFLKTCDKEEFTAGLLNILDSALKYNYSVDWALDELQGYVEKADASSPAVDVHYYIEYIYLLSIYSFKRGKIEYAINLIIENIVLSGRLKDETGFKKATAFYELVRTDANASQQQEYHYIMKKIIEREFNDEKEAFVIDHRITD